MSWALIAALSLAYWVILFLRMRARGRRELSQAIRQAAATHAPGESFEVSVSAELRPFRMAGVVLAIPVLLVLLRLLFVQRAH